MRNCCVRAPNTTVAFTSHSSSPVPFVQVANVLDALVSIGAELNGLPEALEDAGVVGRAAQLGVLIASFTECI